MLLSAAVIVAAAALIFGATNAFFSDSETSTGNTFEAGAIDLKIDNTSYAIDYNIPNFDGSPTGAFVASGHTTWESKDLTTAEKFFDFKDLKPGDYGEDTISITVGSNDAWLCASARITSDLDNDINDPEDEVDGPTPGDGTADGDLDSGVNFAFWKDDGDNVFEQGEPTPFLSGPLSGLGAAGKIALVDSSGGPLGPSPVPGNATSYIGKTWCYGTLTPNPVASGSGTPITRGTGFTCDGSGVGNIGQTDSVTGDLQFYAIQSRNNASFTCAQNYTPTWPAGQTVVIDDTEDLDPGPTATAATNGSGKWFMYEDTTDTIDNTLGSFVAGPSTPPNGSGSIQFTLGPTLPEQRKNIATFQFSGTTLASITDMSFGAYSHGGTGGAGVTESPFFHFNVDFNNSGSFQNRLVYVPSNNGAVPQDAWNTYDVINSGNAMWVYSGATWPAPNVEPGTTAKTWTEILTDYPLVRILPLGGFLGVRVGEPGPNGYIGNVDFVKINGTTYDFDN